MGNYIVFDLEWNQGNSIREKEIKELPFEIIEIGAVRYDESRVRTGEFSQLIRPQVYHEMHKITERLIHISMKDLAQGESFQNTAEEFLKWCGEDPIFCTWGTLDLPELQRNMEYYHMTPLSDKPIRFFDVQKLFSIAYEDGKSRRSLEYAIDFMNFDKDKAFHRALSDAAYTGQIFSEIDEKLLRNISFDSFVTPKEKRQEIHIVFDDYAKYISREFETKENLLADPEVMSTKCYLCHKNLRRKIRWFSPNGKHYYAVSKCDKHGFMKSKVRVRVAEDGKVYAVKTSKFIGDDDLAQIRTKQERAKIHHRMTQAKKRNKEG